MNAKERRRQRREAQRSAEQADQAVEQAVEQAATNPNHDSGGKGVVEEAAPAGLKPASEMILERRAVRNQWAELAVLKNHAVVATAATFRAAHNQDPQQRPSFRDIARAVSNVTAFNAQQMEQEKRDAGGDQVNVHVQGQVDVNHRTELDITVRIDQYLAEYDALASATGVDARTRLVGVNGSNGVAKQVDSAQPHHQANGVSGPP